MGAIVLFSAFSLGYRDALAHRPIAAGQKVQLALVTVLTLGVIAMVYLGSYKAGASGCRRSDYHLGPLTRHRNHFSSQITGVVTGQECDRRGDLPRLGRAAERLALRQPVQQIRAAGLLEELVPRDAR